MFLFQLFFVNLQTDIFFRIGTYERVYFFYVGTYICNRLPVMFRVGTYQTLNLKRYLTNTKKYRAIKKRVTPSISY